jgi:cytochrome P450/NADPH-cytochrome P450 reductase
MTVPIPSPPGLPLVGNGFDLDPANSMESLVRLADTYGKGYSQCEN